jgi:hypothetical protein
MPIRVVKEDRKMKGITAFAFAILITLLVASGCSEQNVKPVFNGNSSGTIFVDYVKTYENLEELAADADLIAVGTIDRTIEVVPDEATRDDANRDPRNKQVVSQLGLKW